LGDRPLLPVAHGFDARLGDAVLHEIGLHGRGAALAEREVVLVGAALVRVARDANRDAAVRLEDRHLGVEDGAVVGPEVGLVVVEVHHREQRRARRGGGAGGIARGGLPRGVVGGLASRGFIGGATGGFVGLRATNAVGVGAGGLRRRGRGRRRRRRMVAGR